MERLSALALVCALAAGAAHGQTPVPLAPTTHGNIRLQVPQGWASQTDPQGALTLTDPAGGAQLQLRVRSYAPGVDAEAALREMLAGAGDVERVGGAESDSGEGRLVIVRARDGSGMAAVLIDPDAARGVTITAALTASAERFAEVGGPRLLVDVTNSVRRSDSVAEAPRPSAASGTGSGARLLIAHYLEDLNTTTGSGGWRVRTLTLFPDGTVWTGMSDGPLDELDPSALRRADPDRVGTWRRDGDAIQLHFPHLAGTPSEHSTLRREGEGWRRSRSRRALYLPARPVAPGALRGHFRAEASRTVGTYTGAPVVSAATSDDFWFHADGRFERSLRAGASGRTRGGGGVATRAERASGTYTLDGTVLTLRHDDGAVQRLPVYAWPGDATAVTIGRKRFARR